MRQRIRAVRENQSGFTLTELLIVIVILGILTGIVVFAVGAFSDRGTTAACKSDKKAVEVALEAYRAKNGAYPDASGGTSPMDKLTDPAAQYLREAPSNTGYSITLAAGGVMTVTGC
jgi:general secretion pathway protein G